MSATGRPKNGNRAPERSKDDFFETPAWTVRAIWPHVRPISGNILEPCAGRGAIVEVLTSLYDSTNIYACEINPERAYQCRLLNLAPRVCALSDWLRAPLSSLGYPLGPLDHPRLVITNPPYSLAQEFIEQALKATAPIGGEVCMLLRLNFLGSQKRGQWLVDHKPDVYVLSERPSFTSSLRWDALGQPRCHRKVLGDGTRVMPQCQRPAHHSGDCQTYGTDATEYAWMVWGPTRSGRLHILRPAAYGRENWKDPSEKKDDAPVSSKKRKRPARSTNGRQLKLV